MAPEVRARVFASPDELPRDADLISGHISDGFLRHAYPAAQFVTVLREPRARLLSLWGFCRTLSDDGLAPWGDWAARVRRAREPLGVFLRDRALAAITDNVAVRMLLAPHPLIPADDLIARDAAAALVDAALARLATYAFVDVVENPAGADNLARWIGAALDLPRLNVTPAMPATLRATLDRELDAATFEAMAERCRLDVALWRAIVVTRMSATHPGPLADAVFAETLARHRALHQESTRQTG